MQTFEINQLLDRHRGAGKLWMEFLRAPSLSMGLYVLPTGGADPQQPHTEDEVYYILSGRGQIRVDAEDRPVQPGSIVFVAANAPHHFHSITEHLTALVFFAPAEYSRQTTDDGPQTM
jgi:mannose-6-phosphate isomerase-like protein (cupin superfamily)